MDAQTVQRQVWQVPSLDGHVAELGVHLPAQASKGLLLLPAMGVSARQYERFAASVAVHGVACAVLEWRGCGSSNLRAARRVNWGYRQLLEYDLPATIEVLEQFAPGVRWRIGGHSLGAQFAALHAAVDTRLHGVVIIAGGTPYWRCFPGVQKWVVQSVFAVFETVCFLVGHFPGRRVGFAGNEARGVIRDWCRSGRRGHYRLPALGQDYETALQSLARPLLSVHMSDDWYVPRRSLDHLLAKMPKAAVQRITLGREDLGAERADHFVWMQRPGPVAEKIAAWMQSDD